MLISNTYFDYVTSIISFVNSIIIKSLYDAKAINHYLTLMGEPTPYLEQDQKYYLNLAGIPFVGINGKFSDPTNMTVYSLDTNEYIPFTVSELPNHPMTLVDLKTLGESFNNLLLKYPNNELLIRGIITPIPLVDSINGNDYQILYYDKSLINFNETNLIPKLQSFINNFTTRWDNGNYALTDTLYPATVFGILFSNMVMEIINIRLENCKTPYVCEWHLWNYLSGYFDLSNHKNIIPFEQALWLYRNIDYIIANRGSVKTLDFLNSGFAKPFNLQLSAFAIRNDLGESLDNLNNGKLNNFTRDVSVARYAYGDTVLQPSNIQTLTPIEFIDLLVPTAIENYNNTDKDVNALIQNVNQCLLNDIPSGVIEATVKTNVTLELINETQEQIQNWLFLTSRGFIKYKMLLSLSDVNISNLLINAKDAALLYLYANEKLNNSYTGNINSIVVSGILSNPTLSEQIVRGLVEPRFLTSQYFDRYLNVVNNLTLPSNLYSLADFISYVGRVVSNKFYHLINISEELNYTGRSELMLMTWAFYQSYTCSFTTETTYDEVFNRLRIDTSLWTETTYKEIISQVSKGFIGIELETSNLQSPYSNMLDIIKQLSSYTLTFIDGPSTNYNIPLATILPSIVVNNLLIDNSINLDQKLTTNISHFIETVSVDIKEVEPIKVELLINQYTRVNYFINSYTNIVIHSNVNIFNTFPIIKANI